MNRKIASKYKSQVRRESAPVSWKYVLLAAFCAVFLAVGLFGAARQHFASINYGIKNAKLRKQVEEIRSDQRRLQLAKEVALSPGEIKKNAQNIGFTLMTASNIRTFSPDSETPESPKADQLAEITRDTGTLQKEVKRPNESAAAKVISKAPDTAGATIARKRPEPRAGKIEPTERKTVMTVIRSAPKEEVADLSITRKRKL